MKYRCAHCGQTFESDLSDDEAAAAALAEFGRDPPLTKPARRSV
jgi:hypothetical protein